MKRKLIATIDCGSSNVRCILFDADTGRQVAVESREWSVIADSEYAGAFNFDARTNWDLACECTKAALSKVDPSEVTAVTAAGFRHGIFLLDGKTDEILFGCFNADNRVDVEYFQDRGMEKDVFERTGDWPSTHGLTRLVWLKSHKPELFARISSMMLVSDWVVYRLSGAIATEPGDAASTLLLDVKTRQWDYELADRCGIPRAILPPVVDAGTRVGSVTEKAAEQTGFLPGTPVFCGVADTQAGLVGVGAVGTDVSAIVGGTFWMVCHSTDHPVTDPEYHTRLSCHSEKEQWIYEGLGFYHGLIIRWFRDAFGAEEKEIEKRYGVDAYYLLDNMTKSVPAGSYGLMALMSNTADQRNWRMAAPTFVGWDILDPSKSHKGVFFKALLESACYVAYGEFENIRRILGEDVISESVTLSGGAAHSPVWCQILSDVLGKKVCTPKEREGTALGAAIYAAVGMGYYADVPEAVAKLIHPDRVYEPNAENHALYVREYARWKALYKNGLDILEKGLVCSMWQPPNTMTETQKQDPWHVLR